jgi:hypothetical protein
MMGRLEIFAAGLLILVPSFSTAAESDVDHYATAVYCAAYKLGLVGLPPSAAAACPPYSDVPRGVILPDDVVVYDTKGVELDWYSTSNVKHPGKTALIIAPKPDDAWIPGSAVMDFHQSVLALAGPTVSHPLTSTDLSNLKNAVPEGSRRLFAHIDRVTAVYSAADELYRRHKVFHVAMAADDILTRIYAASNYLGISRSLYLSSKSDPDAANNPYLLSSLLVQVMKDNVDSRGWKDMTNVVQMIVQPDPSHPGLSSPGSEIEAYFNELLMMGKLASLDVSGVDPKSPASMESFMAKMARCPKNQEHAGKAHQRICLDNTVLLPELALSKYGQLLHNQSASNFNQVIDIYSRAAEEWNNPKMSGRPQTRKTVHVDVPSDWAQVPPGPLVK